MDLDHSREVHRGINGLDPHKDVRFVKENTHRDTLSRQVEEASLITWGLEKGLEIRASNDPEFIVCLNRKEEIFAPRLRFF